MTNYKPTAHSQDYWPVGAVRFEIERLSTEARKAKDLELIRGVIARHLDVLVALKDR